MKTEIMTMDEPCPLSARLGLWCQCIRASEDGGSQVQYTRKLLDACRAVPVRIILNPSGYRPASEEK